MLEKAGVFAEHCRGELQKEVVRLNYEAGGVLPSELAEEIAKGMDWEQLNLWKESCQEKINSGEGIYVQLAPKKGKRKEDHSGFLI